ncbi:hypothetical protein [Rhodomicrobium udaipurense]|uniref:Uncharacterized protein n=1 Tax=Rhodomicrobium udaipurense TaxID=1202716 RepID=A0A8I1GH77_9HYPH|nr:hypothetical protein [Rhodomicrobium udaipurense]MBJ7543350.1 hypothetical protein [Rhodomicrobium udaipurense]
MDLGVNDFRKIDLQKLIAAILMTLAATVSPTIGSAAAKDGGLTRESVTRFLDSFTEMRAIAITEGLQASADQDASKNPIGAVVKAVKKSRLKTEAKAIAGKHGFTDVADWADTGRAIAQAYLHLTVGPSRGVARDTLDKHKDNAMKELEKLGLLNEKQKAKLKENLDKAGEELAKEPPAQNVAIVREMKPQIEATVKLGVN